jgi:hypothetical protein
VQVDRRSESGARDAGDPAVREAERTAAVSRQAEQDRHQDAQLAAMGNDENVMTRVRWVGRVDPLNKPARAAPELTDTLPTRSGSPLPVKVATVPGVTKSVLA